MDSAAATASVRPAAALALMIGVTAAATYCAQGLTLSHYDAKAHLVVARRIVDSLQPGWMQIGAVWLPLPHLLNSVPGVAHRRDIRAGMPDPVVPKSRLARRPHADRPAAEVG